MSCCFIYSVPSSHVFSVVVVIVVIRCVHYVFFIFSLCSGKSAHRCRYQCGFFHFQLTLHDTCFECANTYGNSQTCVLRLGYLYVGIFVLTRIKHCRAEFLHLVFNRRLLTTNQLQHTSNNHRIEIKQYFQFTYGIELVFVTPQPFFFLFV